MYPRKTSRPLKHKQSGSMLVTAIFVLVVMAILGFAMIRLLAGASDAGVQQVLGLRAFNAAQSGLEAKVSEVFPLVNGGHDQDQCDGTLSHTFTNAGLEDCRVTAECAIAYEDTEVIYYRFTGTGQCQVDEYITSRTLSVDAKVEL